MRKSAPFMLRWSINTSGPHNDIHLHVHLHVYVAIIYKTRHRDITYTIGVKTHLLIH